MKIGYACLAVDVPNTQFKNCILRNATEEKLTQIIKHNLRVLDTITDYNISNNIMLYRISSGLIPFGSSPVNTLDWQTIFADEFFVLGEKIKNAGIRVSMHPGQYSVLNSIDGDIVKRATEDLRYHNAVLRSLNTNQESKIILHVGGIYRDKNTALIRFIDAFQSLDGEIKSRLVIENDDRAFTIFDVLSISKILGIPVVFDNLHNMINPSDPEKDDFYWIEECRKTWKKSDGDQKIHYSEQDPRKQRGAHSETIDEIRFRDFVRELNRNDIDIMLEVKDKNLSAVRCINILKDLSEK